MLFFTILCRLIPAPEETEYICAPVQHILFLFGRKVKKYFCLFFQAPKAAGKNFANAKHNGSIPK